MTEHKVGAGGIGIQREQCLREVAATIAAGVARYRTDGRKAENPAGVRIDFEVDRDASRENFFRPHCLSRIPVVEEVESDMRTPPRAIRKLAKVHRLENIGANAVNDPIRPPAGRVPRQMGVARRREVLWFAGFKGLSTEAAERRPCMTAHDSWSFGSSSTDGKNTGRRDNWRLGFD